MIPNKYQISPIESITLLQNVLTCEEASNDADRTVDEILTELDSRKWYLSKSLLETSLYCCSMNSEQNKFYHPRGWTFAKFLANLIDGDLEFDTYYNFIRMREEDAAPQDKDT